MRTEDGVDIQITRKRGYNFYLGQQVIMTPLAIQQYLHRPSNIRTGTVVGYGGNGGLIRVRKDGQTSNSAYSPSFWTGAK